MSETLTRFELAQGVRGTGLRLDGGTAQMFLSWWISSGVVEELTPGRYRLTDRGRELAGWIARLDDPGSTVVT